MLGVKSAIVRRLILTLLLFVEMTTFFVYFNADFYLQVMLPFYTCLVLVIFCR